MAKSSSFFGFKTWLIPVLAIILLIGCVLVYKAYDNHKQSLIQQAKKEEQLLHIKSLINEANSLLAENKIETAVKKAAEALLIDPQNETAIAFEKEILDKVRQSEALTVKIDADLAWEKLQYNRIPRVEGLIALLDEAARTYRIGQEAYNNKQWIMSADTYKQLLKQIDKINIINTSRERALETRGLCNRHKDVSVRLHAHETAPSLVEKADKVYTDAEYLFGQADFDAANKEFLRAIELYEETNQFANGMILYNRAKMAFQKQFTDLDKEFVAKYANKELINALSSAQLGDTSSSEPEQGINYYAKAIEMLAKAEKDAQANFEIEKNKQLADLTNQAEKALTDNNFDNAIQLFEKAQELSDTDLTFKVNNIKRLKLEEERKQKIINLLEQARENDSKEKGWTALKQIQELLSLDINHKQALELKEKILSYYLMTNSIGMKLMYIPAGKFIMGCNYGEPDEKPAHEVIITDGFYIGQFEVTTAQYQTVMFGRVHNQESANLPIRWIKWDEAVKFCEKLSEIDGKKYTLPSEAQWEYACRAGTTSDYYFGNDENLLHHYEWYSDNSGFERNPVGQKKSNPWGLYDMLGNIDEWCLDNYYQNFYSEICNENPICQRPTKQYVARGGLYNSRAYFSRSSARRFNTNICHIGSPGMRVVCLSKFQE